MRNLLDLREKGLEKVRIVERIVFKPRSFPYEMIRMVSVVAIVLAIGFGVSNADDLNPFIEDGIETATDNFSAIGSVSEITEDKIILSNARGSDGKNEANYTLDINHLEKVETNANQPLIISDVIVGDTIVAQGLTNGQKFFIKRIISFGGGVRVPLEDVATSTLVVATTTEDQLVDLNNASSSADSSNVATPTEENIVGDSATSTASVDDPNGDISATSSTSTDLTQTENGTSTASSTTSVIDVVGEVVEEIVEVVTDVIEKVVDVVTGSASSSPDVSPEIQSENPSTDGQQESGDQQQEITNESNDDLEDASQEGDSESSSTVEPASEDDETVSDQVQEESPEPVI